MSYGTLSAIIFVVAIVAYFITLHLVQLTLSDSWLGIWKVIWLACLVGLCFMAAETPPPSGSPLKTLMALAFALCFIGHASVIIAVEQELPNGM